MLIFVCCAITSSFDAILLVALDLFSVFSWNSNYGVTPCTYELFLLSLLVVSELEGRVFTSLIHF